MHFWVLANVSFLRPETGRGTFALVCNLRGPIQVMVFHLHYIRREKGDYRYSTYAVHTIIPAAVDALAVAFPTKQKSGKRHEKQRGGQKRKNKNRPENYVGSRRREINERQGRNFPPPPIEACRSPPSTVVCGGGGGCAATAAAAVAVAAAAAIGGEAGISVRLWHSHQISDDRPPHV